MSIKVFDFGQLQQYLPFTVLKPFLTAIRLVPAPISVATVLTVYGIETYIAVGDLSVIQVATVLTVYGIETKTDCF